MTNHDETTVPGGDEPTEAPSDKKEAALELPPAADLQRDAQQVLAAQLVEQAQADGVELVGPDGLLADITKLVLEAGLEVEMTDHIGYEKHAAVGRNGENSRNGTRAKTVLTDVGTGGDRRAPRSRRHLRAEDGEETPTAPDRCR